ncbi:MAG: hypothetical protein ACPMAQ_10605, partial [Phycisphaerae bacterium]
MSRNVFARVGAPGFVAAILVAATGVGTASAGMITVDVTPLVSQVTPDQTFDVKITADLTEPLVAFGFHLVFDESLLTLDSVAVAPPFKPLVAPGSPLTSVAGYTFPAVGPADNVLLATATFTAKAAGAPAVGIGTTPGDPSEGFVQHGVSGLSDVTVAPAVVTVLAPPTPGGGGGGGAGP